MKIYSRYDSTKLIFEGDDLTRANLHGANLTGANLTRANLHGADLTRADLTRADLTRANLHGAVLDFASWPLWCGSVGVICDARLFAQLFFHLTRLDASGCSGGVKEAMDHLRSMAAADLFCEYRDDVEPLQEDKP